MLDIKIIIIRATNYDFLPELDPNSGKKHNYSLIAIFVLVNWGLRERDHAKKLEAERDHAKKLEAEREQLIKLYI